MWDEDERPTSSYQMGTCVVYSGPKRPKPKSPVYGYKFVPQGAVVKKRKGGGKKKC